MLRVNRLAVAVCLCWMLTTLGYNSEAQTIVNTLRVGERDGGSTIVTVLGCMERFVCEGVGDDIRWRFLNTRRDLENTTYRKITTRTNGSNVTSHLIFNKVMPEHDATYLCIIRDTTTRRTTSLSARLTVNNTRVYIEPLSNINISGIVVGETISFSCSIQTCEENVTVSIRKGSQVHQQMVIDKRMNIVTINQDLTISEDTVGEYSCHVLLPDETSFVERFNITGTPQGPATTTPSNMNSNPSIRNSATSLFQVHSPLHFFLLLLSITAATVSML